MLCEKCERKRASVIYRESADGKVRTLSLCDECADTMKSSGELEDFSAAMSVTAPMTVMAGLNAYLLIPEDTPLRESLLPSAPASRIDTVCPRCGMSLSDTATAGGVGCAVCYTVFADQLEPPRMVGGNTLRHIGTTPAGYRARQERTLRITTLREELTVAVEAERFEEAATLRDRIRELEKEVQ